MTTTDRRVQRTREQLQQALIDLVSERRYDALTIQEIVERANVGRTTFYLHYTGKDDLFMSCHEAIVGEFRSGPLYRHPLSREDLLSPEAPAGVAVAYPHLPKAGGRVAPLFSGQDGPLIPPRLPERSAPEIEAKLRSAFAGVGRAT